MCMCIHTCACLDMPCPCALPLPKVLALWRYDKGEANGAPFIYFGIEPTAAAGPRAAAICAYAVAVLDALCWRWGPVHMEVMWVEGRGPVLIEANCGRLNGEEFKTIAEAHRGRLGLSLTRALWSLHPL